MFRNTKQHIVKAIFLAIAFSASLAFAAPPAHAQVAGIAAVVNDDVISFSDLRDRMAIAISAAGLQDSEEIRARLQPQVVQTLIDEKLKLQEAKRLELQVTEEELDEELRLMAERNSMTPEGFASMINGLGIPMSSLRDQMRADVAWRKVIQARLNRQVSISKDDIAIRRDQIRQQQTQTAYLVQEIFLPVDDPSQSQQVEALARRLLEQIRQGAPFVAVAAQFSRGVGAQNGGSLGWVQPGQLAPELDAILPRIGVNRISPPVRTQDGWHLLAIRNVREPKAAENTKVSLKQLIFEPVEGQSASERIAAAATAAKNIADCDAMQAAIDASSSNLSSDMGEVTLGNLNPTFQAAVSNLSVGQISAPLNLGEIAALVMVCGREEGDLTLPSDTEIENTLSLERLDLLQKRYLRDLRSAAYIDRRTAEE